MDIPEPRKKRKFRDPINNSHNIANAWLVLDKNELFQKFEGLEKEMLSLLVKIEEDKCNV